MRSTFVRVGAIVAVAGGVLRALGSFAPVYLSSPRARDALYAAVDLCLAVGLLAFHSRSGRHLRWWGDAGFLLALAGIVAIRANGWLSPIDLYGAGALAVAGGTLMLCTSAWRANQIAGWVPLGFLLSLLAGILGTVVPNASALFVLSGIVFGIAFAGVGAATFASCP